MSDQYKLKDAALYKDIISSDNQYKLEDAALYKDMLTSDNQYKLEDTTINNKNRYHKKDIDFINMKSIVEDNTYILYLVLVPIFIMFVLFTKSKKDGATCGKDADNSRQISTTMYSLMLVSLILTIGEIIYIFSFNVQRVNNEIIDAFDRFVDYNGYIDIKRLHTVIPNVILTESKKNQEEHLRTLSFCLYFPVIMIFIFMLTSLTGCINLSFKQLLAIIINGFILIFIFAITFVNLGLKVSDPINFKEIVDNFDPYSDVHRYQTEFEFMQKKKTMTMFLSFLTVILFFVSFIANSGLLFIITTIVAIISISIIATKNETGTNLAI